MKAFRALLTVLTLVVLFLFSGCGGGGGGSESIQDKQLALLAGTATKTWVVASQTSGSVYLNSTQDSTSHWKNFTLTISGTKGATTFSYQCAGRPKYSVWPATGNWSFDTTSPSLFIIRDPGTNDELKLGYVVDAAGKNLQITLTFNNPNGGYTRTENVNGAWTFNMIPQTN